HEAQPQAPARQLGRFVARAEVRCAEHAGHLGRILPVADLEAAPRRALPDAIHVETPAIVLDHDAQLSAARPLERHVDAPGGRLARRNPRRGVLDAVVDGIAYQVAERLDERLQEARLEQLLTP